MFRFIIRMFQKLLEKDWNKIIVNWIWIYQYVVSDFMSCH